MTLAEVIYQHSLGLPEPAVREVLDFIEVLEQRYRVASSQGADGLTTEQREAPERLSRVRIHVGAKPIPDRDQLVDDARG